MVELLVVIAVVAILGTVGFLSLRNMNDTARDATRLSDIKNVTSSLGFYLTQHGVVPHPTNKTIVTYSGATAWFQGTLGTSVIIPLGNPSKRPLDPLLNTEYTYSVTNDESQYQLWGIYEWASFVSSSIFPQANAAGEVKYKTFVSGNYNGSILKLGSTILAVPSIILSNTSTPSATEIKTMGGYNFVMKNSYNPPASLSTTVNTTITQTDKPYLPTFEELKNWTSNKIAVWTGSTLPKTINDVTTFSANLKDAYTWAPTNTNTALNDIIVSSGDTLKYKASLLLNAEYHTKINTAVFDLTITTPVIYEPCTFSPTGTGWLFDNCSL